MKLSRLFNATLAFVTLVSAISCFDGDYDLSDINTLSRFNVKDLTVPMNLDSITLKSVLNIKEDDNIKEIDGEYAFTEEGEIESDPICVDAFTTDVPSISPATKSFRFKNIYSTSTSSRKETAGDNLLVSADIPDVATSFNVNSYSVSNYIKTLEEVKCRGTFSIAIELKGVPSYIKRIELEDCTMKIIKGLTFANLKSGYSYDSNTGELHIDNLTAENVNNKFNTTVQFDITGIDCDLAGVKYSNPNFQMSANVSAKGKINIYNSGISTSTTLTDIVSELCSLDMGYSLQPKISSIYVNSFTGIMKYDIHGIDIAPITLDNIPDLLSGDDTNITLANPQIFLKITNPLYGYRLGAEAKAQITPSWNGVEKSTFISDEKMVTDKNAQTTYFCLSPNKPSKYQPGYETSKHVKFSTLGSILNGDGLPDQLNVDLLDPNIYEQHVSKFKMDYDHDPVVGEYYLFAPLDFTSDTHIKYSSIECGWNDEDVDAITITGLTVKANLSSDVPFALQILLRPLVIDDTAEESKVVAVNEDGHKVVYATDENGNTITAKATVKANGEYTTTVPAKASNLPLSAKIESQINHLDGIEYVAVITDAEGETFRPDHSIILTGIRATVDGYYEKEL